MDMFYNRQPEQKYFSDHSLYGNITSNRIGVDVSSNDVPVNNKILTNSFDIFVESKGFDNYNRKSTKFPQLPERLPDKPKIIDVIHNDKGFIKPLRFEHEQISVDIGLNENAIHNDKGFIKPLRFEHEQISVDIGLNENAIHSDKGFIKPLYNNSTHTYAKQGEGHGENWPSTVAQDFREYT